MNHNVQGTNYSSFKSLSGHLRQATCSWPLLQYGSDSTVVRFLKKCPEDSKVMHKKPHHNKHAVLNFAHKFCMWIKKVSKSRMQDLPHLKYGWTLESTVNQLLDPTQILKSTDMRKRLKVQSNMTSGYNQKTSPVASGSSHSVLHCRIENCRQLISR